MVGQEALWPPHQRYVEADDSFSSGLTCWWLLRSGQNACTCLSLQRGPPNPSKHPHTSQERRSFHHQAFVCFWTSWISSAPGTFTITLIWPSNIYFAKRKNLFTWRVPRSSIFSCPNSSSCFLFLCSLLPQEKIPNILFACLTDARNNAGICRDLQWVQVLFPGHLQLTMVYI